MDRITNLLGVANQQVPQAAKKTKAGQSVRAAFTRAEKAAVKRSGSEYRNLQLELLKKTEQLHRQIHARLEAEQALQRLEVENHTWLEALERERQRIGQDLHDTLGQQLSGIKFFCTALAQRADHNEPISASDLHYIEEQVNAALSQARSRAKDLCLLNVEQKGLAVALRELAEFWRPVQVHCQVHCTDAVDSPDKTAQREFYQIAQESVTNAVKHAGARNIHIEVQLAGDDWILKIANDGIPFSANSDKSEGIGLKVMRSRANRLGATFQIEAEASGQTVVTCCLPHKTTPSPHYESHESLSSVSTEEPHSVSG